MAPPQQERTTGLARRASRHARRLDPVPIIRRRRSKGKRRTESLSVASPAGREVALALIVLPKSCDWVLAVASATRGPPNSGVGVVAERTSDAPSRSLRRPARVPEAAGACGWFGTASHAATGPVPVPWAERPTGQAQPTETPAAGPDRILHSDPSAGTHQHWSGAAAVLSPPPNGCRRRGAARRARASRCAYWSTAWTARQCVGSMDDVCRGRPPPEGEAKSREPAFGGKVHGAEDR